MTTRVAGFRKGETSNLIGVSRTPPPAPPSEALPRKRGPVPKLSADKIAAAVIDVGFADASVTSVAERLGVTHAALYRYIDDRDAMMRTALERVTAAHEWPELVDDWREVLWNECRGWWAFCERYPGFAGITPESDRALAAVADWIRSRVPPARR